MHERIPQVMALLSFQEKEHLLWYLSPFTCCAAEPGRTWQWVRCNHEQKCKLGIMLTWAVNGEENKGCHRKPSEMVSPPPFAVLGNMGPVLEVKWGRISGHSLPEQVSSTVLAACSSTSDVGHPWLQYLKQVMFSSSKFHHNSPSVLLSPHLYHLTSLLFSSDCLLWLSTEGSA